MHNVRVGRRSHFSFQVQTNQTALRRAQWPIQPVLQQSPSLEDRWTQRHLRLQNHSSSSQRSLHPNSNPDLIPRPSPPQEKNQSPNRRLYLLRLHPDLSYFLNSKHHQKPSLPPKSPPQKPTLTRTPQWQCLPQADRTPLKGKEGSSHITPKRSPNTFRAQTLLDHRKRSRTEMEEEEDGEKTEDEEAGNGVMSGGRKKGSSVRTDVGFGEGKDLIPVDDEALDLISDEAEVLEAFEGAMRSQTRKEDEVEEGRESKRQKLEIEKSPSLRKEPTLLSPQEESKLQSQAKEESSLPLVEADSLRRVSTSSKSLHSLSFASASSISTPSFIGGGGYGQNRHIGREILEQWEEEEREREEKERAEREEEEREREERRRKALEEEEAWESANRELDCSVSALLRGRTGEEQGVRVEPSSSPLPVALEVGSGLEKKHRSSLPPVSESYRRSRSHTPAHLHSIAPHHLVNTPHHLPAIASRSHPASPNKLDITEKLDTTIMEAERIGEAMDRMREMLVQAKRVAQERDEEMQRLKRENGELKAQIEHLKQLAADAGLTQ
ncbi:hypothetical protein BT69DRAFT_541762 [Atractiella rhizophila]|nr:hypothetical protein BT69DRAFT_541762 [Atractiella rhizophila]